MFGPECLLEAGATCEDTEESDTAASAAHEDGDQPVEDDNEEEKSESFSRTISLTLRILPRPDAVVCTLGSISPTNNYDDCIEKARQF